MSDAKISFTADSKSIDKVMDDILKRIAEIREAAGSIGFNGTGGEGEGGSVGGGGAGVTGGYSGRSSGGKFNTAASVSTSSPKYYTGVGSRSWGGMYTRNTGRQQSIADWNAAYRDTVDPTVADIEEKHSTFASGYLDRVNHAASSLQLAGMTRTSPLAMGSADATRSVETALRNAFRSRPGLFGNTVDPNLFDPSVQSGVLGLQHRQTLQNMFQSKYMVWGASLVGQQVAQGMSLMANNTANGTYDPMAASGLYGGLLGAASGAGLGALLASPGGEVTGAVGSSIMAGGLLGQNLGEGVGRLLMAPFMRDRTAALALSPIASAMRQNPYQLLGIRSGMPDGKQMNERLMQTVNDISHGNKGVLDNLLLSSGLYAGTDILSTPQYANVYAGYASALFGSGRDDRDAASLTPGELSRRTASRYGLASETIAGKVAPIFANRRRYEAEIEDTTAGGLFGRTTRNGRTTRKVTSYTDIMLEHGAESYQHYADLTDAPDLNPNRMRALADYQESGTAGEYAGLQIRGAGKALRESTSRGMDALRRLPNGEYSRAYAGLRKQNVAAQFAEFQEQDSMSYGVPMAHLQGAMDRSSVLPFSPGYGFGLQLQMLGKRSHYLTTLNSRYRTLKSRGDLSEAEDLNMVNQMEGLETQNAQGIASISEGFENRLPAMMTGRARWSGRFNSLDGAAMSLAGMGHPSRAFGALNGQHLRNQDDFVRSFGGAVSGQIGVGSTTTGLNNAPLLAAIDRLTRAIEGRGGGTRPDEARGQANAAIERSDLGTNRAYGQKK